MEVTKKKRGYFKRIFFNTWLYLFFLVFLFLKLSSLGSWGYIISLSLLMVISALVFKRVGQQKFFIFNLKTDKNKVEIDYLEKDSHKSVRFDVHELKATVSPLFPLKGRWVLRIYMHNQEVLSQTSDFDWCYEELVSIQKQIAGSTIDD